MKVRKTCCFFRTTTAELLEPHLLLTNSLPAAPEVKGPSSRNMLQGHLGHEASKITA